MKNRSKEKKMLEFIITTAVFPCLILSATLILPIILQQNNESELWLSWQGLLGSSLVVFSLPLLSFVLIVTRKKQMLGNGSDLGLLGLVSASFGVISSVVGFFYILAITNAMLGLAFSVGYAFAIAMNWQELKIRTAK